ncbi:hypothetical protein IWQ60_003409 [Tieghemiomyces parasiticus]|uniref:Ribosomal protein S2 n=1 Tax=Tieghemiomyces parasiticus TaxID=78921 RepID=A0A9W8AHX9_9FUNG|nr:hypothetical protein IWQ60_003409 [Tieghemiomyces parasiticus]
MAGLCPRLTRQIVTSRTLRASVRVRPTLRPLGLRHQSTDGGFLSHGPGDAAAAGPPPPASPTAASSAPIAPTRSGPALSPLALTQRLQRLMPEFSALGARRTRAPQLTPALDRKDLQPNEFTMAELMAAGLHLGHSKTRWNPFTLPFIFGEREGIYVINLEHTVAYLRRALALTREVARDGGLILFLASRPSMVQPVAEAATACGQYHVNGKWLPGTLTNNEVVLTRFVPELIHESGEEASPYMMVEDGSSAARDKAKKKAPKALEDEEEVSGSSGDGDIMSSEETVITRNASGTVQEESDQNPKLRKVLKVFKPDLMIFFNTLENKAALTEARACNIPTIGLIDTDCSPHWVSYPVPANDDSTTGVKLLAALFSKAAQEGAELRRKDFDAQVKS